MSDIVLPGVSRWATLTATLALGLPLTLGGCSVDLNVQPAPQPAAGPPVSKADLSRQLADQFAQRTGRRPAEMNCPDDLPRAIGATVQCQMIDADRHTVVATATITDRNRISYQFDIDLATPPTPGSGPGR